MTTASDPVQFTEDYWKELQTCQKKKFLFPKSKYEGLYMYSDTIEYFSKCRLMNISISYVQWILRSG
jgi:hypothetical protein